MCAACQAGGDLSSSSGVLGQGDSLGAHHSKTTKHQQKHMKKEPGPNENPKDAVEVPKGQKAWAIKKERTSLMM